MTLRIYDERARYPSQYDAGFGLKRRMAMTLYLQRVVFIYDGSMQLQHDACSYLHDIRNAGR